LAFGLADAGIDQWSRTGDVFRIHPFASSQGKEYLAHIACVACSVEAAARPPHQLVSAHARRTRSSGRRWLLIRNCHTPLLLLLLG